MSCVSWCYKFPPIEFSEADSLFYSPNLINDERLKHNKNFSNKMKKKIRIYCTVFSKDVIIRNIYIFFIQIDNNKR